MKNEITIFTNAEFGEIRTIENGGQAYFCLADICRILDLEQVSRVKDRLKEDGVTTSKVIDRLGREQEAVFINESNLYKTVLYFFEQKEWRRGLIFEKLGLVQKPLAPETQKIFDKLKKCTTQEEIDSILQNEDITETAEKCRILRRCMNFSEYLGEAGKTPDNDDYEFDCAVFLSEYADI